MKSAIFQVWTFATNNTPLDTPLFAPEMSLSGAIFNNFRHNFRYLILGSTCSAHSRQMLSPVFLLSPFWLLTVTPWTASRRRPSGTSTPRCAASASAVGSSPATASFAGWPRGSGSWTSRLHLERETPSFVEIRLSLENAAFINWMRKVKKKF